MVRKNIVNKKEVKREDVLRGLASERGRLEIKLSLIILSILLVLVIMPLGIAQDVSVCCEKTTSGAWCQNTPEENCDTGFRKTPTSCKSTMSLTL